MAKYGSKDVRFILIGGYDLRSSILSLEDQGVEAVVDNVTPLGDAYQKILDTGSREPLDLKLDVLYDDATPEGSSASPRTVFVGAQGVTRVVLWDVTGNTVGAEFSGYAGAVETKNSRVSVIKKLHRQVVQLIGSGPHEFGTVLHAHTAETADGNTQATSVDWAANAKARTTAILTSSVANPTVIDCGTVPHGLTTGDSVVIAGHTGSTPAVSGQYIATVVNTFTFTVPVNVTVGGTGGTVTQASTTTSSNGTGGGAGYLAVSALVLGAATNLAAKVKHSVDNASFVDLITFTAVTAAPAAERIATSTTTTIYQYLAASWVFTGGGGTSATFVVGFARAAQQ